MTTRRSAQRKSAQSNEGEGGKTAARRYNREAEKFAQSGGVEPAARQAREDVEGDRAQELREAEKRGKQRAAEEDPAVTGDVAAGSDAYAEVFEHLDDDARRWAVQRAGALMEQGYAEGPAMRMAAALAREWVDNGKASSDGMPGPSQHVMHDREGWMICPEDESAPTHVFARMEDALQRAHQIATEQHSAVYVHDPDGAVIDKYESYGGGGLDGEPAYHVIPYDGAWALKRVAADGVFERYPTKREAVARGRELAEDHRAMLVVHYQSGEVEREQQFD